MSNTNQTTPMNDTRDKRKIASAHPVSNVATVNTGNSRMAQTNATTSSKRHQHDSLRAFELPDGRIMDAKNTLQSFDVVPTPGQRVALAFAQHPDLKRNQDQLPSGDNGTCRDVENIDIVVSSSAGIQNSSHAFNSNDACNVIVDEDVINANAVAVYSVIVADGDVVDAQDTPASPYLRKSTMIWLMIVVLVGILAGIGGYCGSGQCSSKEGETSRSSSSLSSTTTTPTTTTTANTAPIKPNDPPTVQSPGIPTKSPLAQPGSALNSSASPSIRPAIEISTIPTNEPTIEISTRPTNQPINLISTMPSNQPTIKISTMPTIQPSFGRSQIESLSPTKGLSNSFSSSPSTSCDYLNKICKGNSTQDDSAPVAKCLGLALTGCANKA